MGLTRRAALVIFRGRSVLNKKTGLLNLYLASLFFLSCITLEAVAGTYVYYDEKGERVATINKNETQRVEKDDTESVSLVDTDDNRTQDNTIQDDNSPKYIRQENDKKR